MSSLALWLVGCFLLGMAVGLVIGRWWALLLAASVPLAFIPAGDDSDGAPEWQTALVLLMPFAVAGIALGVAGRRSRGSNGPDTARSS